MATASVVPHLIGAPSSGEGAERAEHAVAVPTVIGPLGAVLMLGILWLRHPRDLRPVWFLLLPAAAFAIQEVAERLVLGPGAEPSLLATVLIQAPFALLAFVLARWVLTVVRRVVRSLTAGPLGSRPRVIAASWPTVRLVIPPRWFSGGAHRGRAPPALA